ncbi:sugar diacid recognition domain-containing protein [Thalassobacillus sp. CUG 92003]|uniref:CdaR family transcriptional regulator n=1 Tax=Thalassobacillus sp. CUG 92003 TaxID=2736641 RepID=UPI0015E7CA64|nr:sugar diacid recognition domain-containing protein [Thalassobacillus sp. CUG 92003]
MLTKELGNEIIQRLSEYIECPINLMNASGKIVASTDNDRVEQLHGGAEKVIEYLEPQSINHEDVDQFSNVKPGVNLPIFHRGQLAGVVGLTGKPEEVVQAAGMTRGSVEIALEQIYVQRQSFYQERLWSHWLQQLFHPSSFDEHHVQQEATYTLNVETGTWWCVVVFVTKNHFDMAERIRSLFEEEHLNPLFVMPYQESSIITALPVTEVMSSLYELGHNNVGQDVRVGLGDRGYGIRGIRQSYFQAWEALDLSDQDVTVAYSGDYEMERVLNSVDETVYQDVAAKYRERLETLDHLYTATLDCYFKRNFKQNLTAETLHIHRNTLVYRLEQVKQKTGLDPRVFNQAIILQVLLIKK